MIKVDISRSGKQIIAVIVHNHADAAEHGKDLVCAGVSSIMVGTLNAIDQLCNEMCEMQMQEAYIHIAVKTHCDTLQTILETMRIQLVTMCESYDKFIKINDQEV